MEIIANGNETVILAAGINVKGKATRSANTFTVTDGDQEGEAMLQSPATARAGYIWQKSMDPLPADPPVPTNTSKWEQFAVTMISTVVIGDLVPGTKYWFRVATVTSAGQGLWSDPISYMAK